jgi:hypothetical protein
MKPAPYSPTDTAETSSVNLLDYILTSPLVKCDIAVRNTIPNHDGTVTLVDEEGYPIGQFNVQIKTLPGKFKDSFKCEVGLIAYTKTLTQALIFIGVDNTNKVAYWKQIIPSMEANLKKNQKTFTIKFDLNQDIIKKDSDLHIQRWKAMLADIQLYQAKIPILQEALAERFGLLSIPEQNRLLFQRFIGRLNITLDGELQFIKEKFFPGIRQLGLAILAFDAQQIVYQLFGIKDGSNVPPVISLCDLRTDPLKIWTNIDDMNCWVDHALKKIGIAPLTGAENVEIEITGWGLPNHFQEPEKLATQYANTYIEKAISQRIFRLYGVDLCNEELWLFTEKYTHCLGLSKSNKYSIDEIEQGIRERLPRLLQLTVERLGTTSRNSRFVDPIELLPWLFNFTPEEIANLSLNPGFITAILIHPLIRVALQCIEELKRQGCSELELPHIANPLKPLSLEVEDNSLIEINLKTTLDRSIPAYTAFIEGNRLSKLTSAKHLTHQNTIIYTATESHWTSDRRPLTKHIVRNIDNKLPKVLFLPDSEIQRKDDGRLLYFGGNTYKTIATAFHNDAYFLKSSRPLVNLIYEMLAYDLSELYGLSSPHRFSARHSLLND